MAFSKNCRFSRRFDADPVADVPLSMAENKSDPKINYSNRLNYSEPEDNTINYMDIIALGKKDKNVKLKGQGEII